MGLKIVTAPTVEPITLEDYAKTHLNVDAATDDSLIALYIRTARRHCENFTGRVFITQTWDYYLDAFPDGDIAIPYPPLQSIASIKYKDTNGVLQTWAATKYIVDILSQPGRVSLAYGQSYPTTYSEIQAVQIRFVAGYGLAADVPECIKQAILLKVADLYEHRGDDAVDERVEKAVECLLWNDRIVTA